MDWERYKALCDTPPVCSRWLLEQTLELVEDEQLRRRLRTVLSQTPLEKPDDHRGGAATDMFVMDLSRIEVAAVRRRVEHAADAGSTTSATHGRGLGGFVEAWREYERYLEERELTAPGQRRR